MTDLQMARPVDIYLCNQEVAYSQPLKWRNKLFRHHGPFGHRLTNHPETLELLTHYLYDEKPQKWLRYDSPTILHYIKSLVGNSGLKSILSQTKGKLQIPSSGIQLITLALYFGAKKVTVAGIEAKLSGYVDGTANKNPHLEFDRLYLKELAKHNYPINVQSQSCGLSNYFPVHTN